MGASPSSANSKSNKSNKSNNKSIGPVLGLRNAGDINHVILSRKEKLYFDAASETISEIMQSRMSDLGVNMSDLKTWHTAISKVTVCTLFEGECTIRQSDYAEANINIQHFKDFLHLFATSTFDETFPKTRAFIVMMDPIQSRSALQLEGGGYKKEGKMSNKRQSPS